MFARLYVLVVLVLLLAGLAVCIPVLVGIVREGLDRQRKWRTGELERYTEDPEFDAGPPAVLAGDGSEDPAAQVTCWYCGAANDGEYGVCRECARWV